MLAAVWLLLQQSIAPAALLMACVFAWLVPRWLRGFLGPALVLKAGGLRVFFVALRLAGLVLWDIVVANLTVARLVLWPWAKAVPAWVQVPLALQQADAVALLAIIITTTPGTVSCVVTPDRGHLLVHALNGGANPAALAAQIKQRYEQPLMEIFA
ncbi:Na+/H+ antiporter subunit E [Roseateles koreensis]|uniref:Na+/H+ antiporter subunit E n=1 Tax=Roseateles koreensis TaxID=2987526 RepID=A0ABT5KVK7_9BURK|nr:Na+/H+ antiporter subunit E [Roseateles koreensis]MDC8786975.1 Na+/H+ antiporter subunit E [Roseateles koreensis]